MRGGSAVGVVVVALLASACGRSTRTEDGTGGNSARGRFHLIEPIARHRQGATAQDYLQTSITFVSDDGNVVVGYSSKDSYENEELQSTDEEALRWTAATGSVAFGALRGTSATSLVAPMAMNPNGSAIVGSAYTDDRSRAFRWTEASGLVDISPPGVMDSEASLVSDDGSVAAGKYTTLEGAGTFYWTEASGPVILEAVPGGYGGFPYYLSPDGRVIAGIAALPCGNPCRDPSVIFRWTEESGVENLGSLPGRESCSIVYNTPVSYTPMMAGRCYADTGEEEPFVWSETLGLRGLGASPPNTYADVNAVSRDGSSALVVVTTIDTRRTSSWRWTDTSGLSEIAPPSGYEGLAFRSGRPTMSGDGSVAIGSMAQYPTVTAFRWSPTTGAETLPPLPGDDSSVATSVTEDGTAISGISVLGSEAPAVPETTRGVRAVLWRDGTVEPVSALLEAQGDPPGSRVHLIDATISRDGRALYGNASTAAGSRAWIAWLAE